MNEIKYYRITHFVLLGIILALSLVLIKLIPFQTTAEDATDDPPTSAQGIEYTATPKSVTSGSVIYKDAEVSDSDKVTLAKFAYSVLDNYFDENINIEGMTSGTLEGFDYDRLYITYIHEGKLRCSQSGSAQSGENRIFLDLVEGNVECIEDTRYGGVLTEDEHPYVDIVFNFLYNKQELASNDLDYLEDQIELGIHAIEIRRNDRSVFFKESVPISKNYGLVKTFERLCSKADFNKNCYQYSDTEIYIYQTLTFKADRYYEITDLYRYNVYVEPEDVSNEVILESLQLGGQWFLNNVNPETGLLEYTYYPSSDKYSSDNNYIRQLASLWSMTEFKTFMETDYLDELIRYSTDYYLQFKTAGNYLLIEDKAKLGYNAFMIMTLIETEYPQKDVLLSDLAGAILSQQNHDGSYNTYFASDRNTGVNYYPGEAMLALMKLYEKTGDQRYLNSVHKAFPYYRDYWRDNKNTAFVPWHTQTYLLLYKEIQDPEIAEFVFEMTDWLIDNHQVFEGDYVDTIGGLPKSEPRYSTSVYMEGINEAYQLALMLEDKGRQEKYSESIKNGVRFILQTQYNSENTFYLENPDRAIGGFTKSLVANDQRNDYTQHAILALIKTYQNSIFE